MALRSAEQLNGLEGIVVVFDLKQVRGTNGGCSLCCAVVRAHKPAPKYCCLTYGGFHLYGDMGPIRSMIMDLET